jgi:hypothetical protein
MGGTSLLLCSKENSASNNHYFKSPQFFFKKFIPTNSDDGLNAYSFGFEKNIYEGYISYGYEFLLSKIEKGFFIDTGLLLKFRSPSIEMNNIKFALTATTSFGVSDCMCFYKVESTKSKEMGSKISLFGSLSTGVECFPVEWLGFSLEYHNRYYGLLYKTDKKHSLEEMKSQYNNIFVVSVRTMW